jgi:hypothetical protein
MPSEALHHMCNDNAYSGTCQGALTNYFNRGRVIRMDRVIRVRWPSRPEMGIGTVVGAVPRRAWTSGYVKVKFDVPGYDNPFRLNYNEVQIVGVER